ncbi:hypothetical protein A8709_31095 [Paenibacillus pectinilyticus]|uniref:NodB homology domain-containing protein n=1 Tax=Paenibacillus pectinilyticus TaxID=512399 RepID=A0A1C0ZVZ7_9BACL|nr:polysaccharide deacetylase family protein [Paenibacillus pectinilyticus]OCT12282.1 hypothetical protein A8709_31095 [Paenibacillus pectinilyticus]
MQQRMEDIHLGSFLFWTILLGVSVYTIVPTIIVRLGGFGAYIKGKRSTGVALTFDDGPDPAYTPQLLDLLQAHQIPATFFVLGSKAERYPELIQRMHREGHLIGIHNYVHWANALLTPKKVRKQLQDTVSVIENILGVKPIHYRPPWGIINVFDFLLMKRFRLVLWSLMVGDWSCSGGKERIKRRLLSRLKHNDIIVLHDSGQTLGADQQAPMHMIEALKDFLEECLRRGVPFMRIDKRIQVDDQSNFESLRLTKRVLIYVWLKWEYVFHWLFKVHPIDPDNPILYSRIRRYSGKPMRLECGEELLAGDQVVELHFNNKHLFQMFLQASSMIQFAVHVRRAMLLFLPSLSVYMKDHPDIKGIYGITMIHRGSKQLGFTVNELPKGIFLTLCNAYLRLLMLVFHPQGLQRTKRGNRLAPRLVAISAKELGKRYPTEEPGAIDPITKSVS